MTNLTSMVSKSGDAFHASVEQTLGAALSDLRSGYLKANKCVLVFLDDSDLDSYVVTQKRAQMSVSQSIGLLEIAKGNAYSDMFD